MTRQQIEAKWQALSARERDAWVAEVVFGWDTARIENAQKAEEYGVPAEIMPRYTSVISAAFTVLFATKGEFFLYRSPTDLYVASFGYEGEYCDECGEEPFVVQAQGKSHVPPEAICLAALIASLQSAEGETKLTEVA